MNVLMDEYEHSAPETLHSTHELTNVKDPVIEKMDWFVEYHLTK